MYTDLIKIEHPPEAEAGQLVTIQVYIKNQYSAAIYIMPTATVNGAIPVTFSPEYASHPAGVEYYYTGTFIMPNENAVITAWSWYYGTDGAWHYEDYQTRTTLLTGGVTPDLETLEIDITPIGGGHVQTEPASEEGRVLWYNGSVGTFLSGTTVQVTAIPATGYEFDHWSDEIEGGVSYENPAMVQPMTERRAVKAHFTEIAAEPTETLGVVISPEEAGHVLTSPASIEGITEWHNDDKGTFPQGTDVQVTAVPSAGYVFDHWSGEIVGGTSTNNPEYVKPMTEGRGVWAHFTEEAVVGEADIENLKILALGLTEDPTSLGAVAAGPGNIIYVKYSFDYIAHQEAEVEVWTSLVIDPFRDYTLKHVATLPVAGTSTKFEQIVGITIPTDISALANKTYDLWIELRGYETAKLESIITLSGMPEETSPFEMIGSLVLVMIVMMMMTMMSDFMEEPVKYVAAGAEALGKGTRVFKK